MPPVYGFHSTQPVAQIYRHPFSGAVIATPVLDLSSVRGPAGYADRSATGANGVVVGAPANARGVFDEAVRFGGVRDTLNCGSNAPLDVAGDISVCCWLRSLEAGGGYIFVKTAGGATGWQFVHNGVGDGRLVYYSYAGPTLVTGVNNVTLGNLFHHCAFTNKSNIGRIFMDGLQEARAAVTASDTPANSLFLMSFNNGSDWQLGELELPQVWNGALSPEQVYKNYLQAKDVPIYYDTFEGYAVTPVAKAAGSMCGPFRVGAGSYEVTVDTAQKHWVRCAVAGNCSRQSEQAYGTWEFDIYRTAAGIDQVLFVATVPGDWTPATQTGYMAYVDVNGRLNFYRIVAGAPLDFFSSGDGTIPLNTAMSIRVVRRVGGQTAVYLKGGAYPDWSPPVLFLSGSCPVTENTNTTSRLFNFYSGTAGNSISNIKQLIPCERPASFPWEFLSGTYAGVVSGSTVWMRCLTAGVTYLPKDLDWQTCTFKLYKGADANVTDVLFVASEIGGSTFANQNGYVLRLAADESVQLIRTTGGIEAAPTAQTAAGYVAITTEYEFKITHNGTTNAYEFFIMGGAYATWTLMFAATLGIHVTSNYFINDLDASDRITAPQFFTDLR